MLDAADLALAPEETPAARPDLDDPNEWPHEPDRDLADENDPENWPAAGDPLDALNDEAERAAGTAAVLRAAADSIEGRPRPAPQPDRDAWSWCEAREEGLVVIGEQPMTSVYRNPFDAIVIRQSDPMSNEDDPYLIFQPEFVPRLIRALAAEIELDVHLISKAPPASSAVPEMKQAHAAQPPGRKRAAPGLFDGEDGR